MSAARAPRPAEAGPLRHYPATDAGDLYRDAPAAVADIWTAVAQGMFTTEGTIHELVARQIADLGLSFRIAGDIDERDWPLTPMPLIVGASEWAAVERGLIQRAELLDRVAADLYGEQRLVADGHLPAATVTGSRFFARDMIGLAPPGSHHLHFYAADLARGPRGQWRILADRLRLPTGIGYALENRLALSRATGSLLTGLNVRRLSAFFADLREGIARDCRRDLPRIALLTPGRFNQSYPEQAHLARYLGFPLVEGRDLTVIDDRLYLRTIEGPRRLDGVWRWIDTNALDPLRFDARSRLGVPDLFDTFARGSVVMANWPGVELLESPAFAAFMPRLCAHLLGEEPLLPTIATWWCGQPREAAIVRERMAELLITPAFGDPVEQLPDMQPLAGASLDAAARTRLLEAMQRRPMDYCGQEIVHLSTTPALVEDAFAPHPFTIRAFVARDADGRWTVMPGGLARLSASGELRTALIGEGDWSADLLIVDRQASPDQHPPPPADPPIRRGGGLLASQAADNLYWFGRYMERAESTLRVIRAILGSSIEVDSIAFRDREVRGLLAALLHQWGAIDAEAGNLPAAQLCRLALTEDALPGAIPALLAMIRGIGASLRDRFAGDFWRLANRPPPTFLSSHGSALLNVTLDLIERFDALTGQIAEDMVRGSGWAFLDMGRRIERAIAIIQMMRQLLPASDESDALNVMLDLADGQISYRSRYLAGPLHNPVFDLLLLDPDNPRSLIFQLQAIRDHLETLPTLNAGQMPEPPLLAARALLAQFVSRTAESLDDAALASAEDRLLALSDAIAQRYFLPFETAETHRRAQWLA